MVNHSEPNGAAATLLRDLRRENERLIGERLGRGVREKELPVSTDVARLAKYFFAVLGAIQL